ncbi:hypothetical protein RRSWK_03003 [Rhodopirellula sp. SWK7]|nr:hypothetical protein RRSWK_03003 [Rhodopirellula sp. SWK7]
MALNPHSRARFNQKASNTRNGELIRHPRRGNPTVRSTITLIGK